MSRPERDRFLKKHNIDVRSCLYDWRLHARPSQRPPADPDWVYWILQAGRGSGKTRAGAEWIRQMKDETGNLSLVGATAADVRDVMVMGPAGLLAISPPDDMPEYSAAMRRVSWKNGAQALLFSAEEPNRLRGPQCGAAWCFIAGTKVLTPLGELPIEEIKPGDRVVTRRGLARVRAAASRVQPVGKVKFSNGRILVGTADHPVATSHGWMKLCDLPQGVNVCVTRASSGAVSAGTATQAVTTNIAAQDGSDALTGTDCIAPSGVRSMGQFQTATMSITGMKTKATTTRTISNLWSTQIISAGTPLPSRYHSLVRNLPMRPNAPIVAGCCYEKAGVIPENIFASHVSTNAPTINAGPSEPAKSAANFSCPYGVISAVSVASIWEPAGEARVHNITVAETPEYFANGVLVHNCDELAAWRYADEAWQNLVFGLRLGKKPRCVITTTPRPTKLLRQLIEDPGTRVTRISSFSNVSHLAPSFFQQIIQRYEGTRLGRQEIEGELLEDVPGALWKLGDIDRDRLAFGAATPELIRIVVSIDPAMTSDEDSDETGIIVAGKDRQDHGYVLADGSGRYQPIEWAREAIAHFRQRRADRIVAEINNGGEMVEHTLRMVDDMLPITVVHATRGKVMRAEPVSALYEQGRVHHVGTFARLEDQMINFTQDWDRARDGSPDRLDALVWAMTELLVEPGPPGVEITDKMLRSLGPPRRHLW